MAPLRRLSLGDGAGADWVKCVFVREALTAWLGQRLGRETEVAVRVTAPFLIVEYLFRMAQRLVLWRVS